MVDPVQVYFLTSAENSRALAMLPPEFRHTAQVCQDLRTLPGAGVVLIDGRTGAEDVLAAVAHARAAMPRAPAIVVGGPPDAAAIVAAVKAGAADYLTDADLDRLPEMLRRENGSGPAERGLCRAEAALWIDRNGTWFAGLLSPDGRVLHINQAALDFIHAGIEEVRGRFFWETPWWTNNPEQQEKVRQAVRDAGAGQAIQIDTVQPLADGSLAEIDFQLTPIRNPGGEVIYLLPWGHDITARRQAERKARALAEELERFYTISPDLLCVADHFGRFARVNPRWEEVLGYRPEELLGRAFLEFVHPEDREVTRRMSVLSESQPVVDFTNRYRHKDGSYHWLEWRSNPTGEWIYAAARDITERKETADALRESEERYRSIIANAPVIIYILDREGVFTLSEGIGLERLGLKAGEVVGRSAYEVYRDYPAIIADLRRALTGERFNCAAVLPGVVFDIRYSPFYDASGAVAGTIGVAVDVTERSAAEGNLRSIENRFQMLFSSMVEGVALHEVLFDPGGEPVDYRIVDFNPQYERILGVERQSILGKWSREAYGTTEPPYLEEFTRCLKEGPQYFETYFPPMRKHFAISVAPWGESGFATIFTDITERKTNEAEIQTLNQSLAQRIIALTQPIGDVSNLALGDIFDLDEIQKIQDAFARATGVASIITDTQGIPITRPSNFCYLCENIIRKTQKGLQNCYHSDAVLGGPHPQGAIMQPCLSGGLWDGGTSIMVGDRHIANWLIGQVLEEPVDEAGMMRYAREIEADEAEFHEALNGVKRMTRQQFADICEALYIIAHQLSVLAVQNIQQSRFISERKKAEEEVLILNSELEKRVGERTAQLQASNHELEAFAYTVSHDLRAPLRAIDGFSQVLAEDYGELLDPPGQDYLQRIRRGAQRMDQLIDSLLGLSRLSRAEMRVGPVDLSALAEQIAAELKEAGPQRTIDWVVAPGLTVYADPVLMRVVLENLLQNAVKFTARHPRARIEIGSERQAEGTIFFVRDDGAGFDMAYAGKLFGVFQRMHDPKEFSGTGVGLATVQRILHRHGGRVWAESAIEKGTTIYFLLPENSQR